jgi:hypothetical protein
MRRSSILPFSAAVLLGGCTTTKYYVAFDGYAARTEVPLAAQRTRVFLIPSADSANPLLSEEVREKTATVLQQHGFILSSWDSADVFVGVAYGIGKPRQVTDNVLVWRPGTTTTLSTPLGVPIATARSNGSLGTRSVTYTQFDRWMTLSAFDAAAYRSTNTAKAIWRGESRSSGTSSDLRTVINYMLVPVGEYFGQSTGRQVTLTIGAKDKRAQITP